MNRFTPSLIVLACLVLLAGGAGAAWLLRDRLTTVPKSTGPRADYDAFVRMLDADETGLREELNELASTATADMSDVDRSRAHALARPCLDVNALLEIELVQRYLAARSDSLAYHFVSDDHRNRLRVYVGDRPSAAEVLALRRALAVVAREFAALRQPPDFKLTIEGESPPDLSFLAIIRDSHLFRPNQWPQPRENPRIPAFSSAEGELLALLEEFFNSPLLEKALPESRYPELRRQGRLPALPVNLIRYEEPIAQAVMKEKRVLIPGEKPDPEGIAAVDDVYERLERFFSAIVGATGK